MRRLQEGFTAEDDIGAHEDYEREDEEAAFRKARVSSLLNPISGHIRLIRN